ncbi:MAG: TolC family protein, partial [Planctomycetota bacterium]
MSSRARIGLVVLGIGLAGCQGYHRGFLTGAEREIDRILDEKRYQAVGQWQENARYPEPAPEPETESETSTGPAETETTLPESKAHVFSLRETMKTATMNNRNFKSQFEALQLSALDAALQRRNFGPIISNTLSYVYANSPSTNADGNASASVGVSKIVPTGGTVETSTSGSVNDDYEGGDTTYAHDVRVSFEQPLLRGYGYDVAYEDLTQAERNVLYALRDFELFRQDFTIDVVRRYYSILRQKQVV